MKVEVQNRKEEIIGLNVGDIVEIKYTDDDIQFYLTATLDNGGINNYRLKNTNGQTHTGKNGSLEEVSEWLTSCSMVKSYKIYPQDKFKLVLQEV